MRRNKEHHHSITSSARASSVGGTSRPSTLAVLRLITSSYFVGTCTGRSAGFSPLRMRKGSRHDSKIFGEQHDVGRGPVRVRRASVLRFGVGAVVVSMAG